MRFYVFLGVVCVIAQVKCQQFGPPPPRAQFAGASLVQGSSPSRSNFRQRVGSPRAIPELIQPVDQSQATRLRRPQQLGRVRQSFPQPQPFDQQRNNIIDDVPLQYKNKIAGPTPAPQFQPQTTKLLTPRPVTEEEINEDEDDSATTITTPSTTAFPAPARPSFSPILQANPAAAGFQKSPFSQPAQLRPQVSIPSAPISFPEQAALQGRQFRPQIRPVQQIQPVQIQVPISRPIPQQIVKPKEEESEEEEEEQYFRPSPIRPIKKQEPIRQQITDQEQVRPQPIRQQQVIRQQQPIRPSPENSRPVQREPHVKASSAQKERKPVVQTIRKYHVENDDGSITWGYENDDGSFKEETIGNDCVTRGKYGYYDPDGVKREYTYSTGIPCDKEQQEAEEAASANEGFIDYTNNKYVFPNGDEIDLEAMVKNRARKPVSQYRN